MVVPLVAMQTVLIKNMFQHPNLIPFPYAIHMLASGKCSIRRLSTRADSFDALFLGSDGFSCEILQCLLEYKPCSFSESDQELPYPYAVTKQLSSGHYMS